MYIYHDRKTDDLFVFSTMRAISQNTGINLDTIKYNLSRLKKKSYEKKEDFKIVKTKLIRVKKNILEF